jgi:hypothetical protein
VKRLYSFGCSFTSLDWKNWCVTQYNYPQNRLYTELLAEELGLELIDSSYSARGNNSILLDFASTSFEDDSVIILQLTGFNRYEFLNFDSSIQRNQTWCFDDYLKGPITTASIKFGEGGDGFFNLDDTQTYFDFVTKFEPLFLINDLYNANKLIQKKEKENKSCKFLLLTIENIFNPIFNVDNDFFIKRKDLIDRINYNGFYEDNREYIWKNWAEKNNINNQQMLNDYHLTEEGNKKVFDKLIGYVNSH